MKNRRTIILSVIIVILDVCSTLNCLGSQTTYNIFDLTSSMTEWSYLKEMFPDLYGTGSGAWHGYVDDLCLYDIHGSADWYVVMSDAMYVEWMTYDQSVNPDDMLEIISDDLQAEPYEYEDDYYLWVIDDKAVELQAHEVPLQIWVGYTSHYEHPELLSKIEQASVSDHSDLMRNDRAEDELSDSLSYEFSAPEFLPVTSDLLDMYHGILEDYQSSFEQHLTMDMLPEGISYILDTSSMNSAGVAFADLNGDGSPEMITGRIDSGDNSDASMIYDVYLSKDGTVVQAATSWLRGRIFLTRTGMIYKSFMQEGKDFNVLSRIGTLSEPLVPVKTVIEGENNPQFFLYENGTGYEILSSDPAYYDELQYFWEDAVLMKVPFTSFSEVFSSSDGLEKGLYDYKEIYADAFQQVYAEHEKYMENDTYSFFGYTLCDMNGDDIREIIFIQLISKWGAHYWVYTSDGEESIYMDDFDWENGLEIGGYLNGMVTFFVHRGAVSIYEFVWNGSSFDKNEVYGGGYNRFAGEEAPELEELTGYIDADRFIEWAPSFVDVTDDSLLRSMS